MSPAPQPSQLDRLLPPAGFILLAAGLTAATFNNPGTSDVTDFLTWAATLIQHNPFDGYALIRDYPPIAPFFLWATISLGRLAHIPDLAALKLAIAAFQALSAFIIGRHLKSWTAAALIWLLIAPYGALLGYVDCFYLPFILLGVFALNANRPASALLMFAASTLTKWQPAILCPVILIYAAAQAAQARDKLSLILPAAGFTLAILAAFGPIQVWDAFHSEATDVYFSGQAFNLAWIETYLFDLFHIAGQSFAPGGNITLINAIISPWFGLTRALFWAAYLANLAICALYKKTPQTLPLALLSAYSIQFNLNTGVHENHGFLMIIFAFIAYASGVLPPINLIFIAAQALANILLFYGFNVINGPLAAAGTVLLALLNLLICVSSVHRHLTAARTAGPEYPRRAAA